MIIALRILAVLALGYQAWIIFRVVNDWVGVVGALFAVVTLPISMMLVAVLMLFIKTAAAGPLALWPAAGFIMCLDWAAKKRGGSLLIRG